LSGYISEVPVDDNASVKAGQVLARIDPRDYQTALDQARANVAAAQAGMNTLNQQIGQQKLVIEQDRQQVVSDQAANRPVAARLPRCRQPYGSLLTLRWRGMDSNF
jgi:membrane fusion protein (multidrug efflux system)